MKPTAAVNARLPQAGSLVGRRFCVGAFVAAALFCAPLVTRAAATEETAAELAQKREAASLRERLNGVNAEVDNLKRAPRSMSVDYRLRQRLADAEVLGRKLTESEAKLRSMQRPVDTKQVNANMAASPSAAATDGPVELAAKADILLDQAQRLSSQADRIESRLQRERVRSTLQARTRHLDQDPFTALEGAKRSLAFSRTEKAATFNGPRTDAKGVEASPDTAAPPVAGGASLSPQAGAPAASAPESTGTPRAPQLDTTTSGNSTTASVSLSFRAFLDAKALAEVERLEASGDPNARAKAMAAAVLALRKQARDLQAKATVLRGTK